MKLQHVQYYGKVSNHKPSASSKGCYTACLLIIYLVTLEQSGLGVKISSVYCGAPMHADDLALIASSPHELQAMIDIVSKYATKWRYRLSPQKSKILVFREPIFPTTSHGQLIAISWRWSRNTSTWEPSGPHCLLQLTGHLVISTWVGPPFFTLSPAPIQLLTLHVTRLCWHGNCTTARHSEPNDRTDVTTPRFSMGCRLCQN